MAPKTVVITGIGCLSPNGNTRSAYFDSLLAGRSGIRKIDRFDVSQLPCQIAGTIQNFEPLDWVSPKDLKHVPLTVPYGIAAASEAMQHAGLQPTELSLEERRRFGVLVGSGGGSIEFTEANYKLFFEGRYLEASFYAIPSGTMGSLSSELSIRFQLKGLSHVVSTGCTSSSDALFYAAQHIQSGRLDRVLCGGIDASISPGSMAGYSLLRIVPFSWNHAPEKASRPFALDREGFVLSEGAWMFVLEDKELAVARGAKIYAELAGYGSTCDAYHRVKLDESGEEPARAIQMALQDAGITPKELDYVHLHGTSTQMNDRVETMALKMALGDQAYHIPSSSTKSMIGHPQGASGAAAVAAIICAMQTHVLPPTINIDTPDPACDLDYVPELGRKHEIEWALSNCIGFGSKNSTLIIKRGDA